MASNPRPAINPLWRPNIPPASLIGVVGIGLLLAKLLEGNRLLPLLALAGATLGLLVLIRPVIGMFALVFAAAFVRVQIGTGSDSPLVASLACAILLLVAWLGHGILNRRQLNFLPKRIAIPAAMLIGATVFSLLLGQVTLDPRVPYPDGFQRVQLAAAALIIISVALLWVGADLFQHRNVRNWIVMILIAVGFMALPFHIMGRQIPVLSVFGLFGLWFVSLAWAFAISNRQLPDPLRIVLGLGAITWLVLHFTLLTSWVSGWLPTIVAVIGTTLILRPRFGVFLLVVGIFAIMVNLAHFQSIMFEETEEGSLEGEFGRFELWNRNLSVIGDRAVLGTGPAGYVPYYVTLVPDRAMSTHSNYIDILAQLGIPGIASLVALLVGLSSAGRAALRRLTVDSDRALCAAIVGAIPGVATAMWFGDWVIPFVYNQTIAGFNHSVYTWLMFAILCGLFAQVRVSGAKHEGT